eukprot:TRINITY_DN575_c0_g1_i2.p1 TRINITY_DN575_c0_g1~~TRINITY_DN575_c0_g1_i2.p1  ORF type:complete len:162 (+),score=17.31 TRINITY_DN575_c0_g1_i2:133-618(+)
MDTDGPDARIRPILKNKSEQPAARKRKIVWDEENLHHNEAAKSATMKIDEPKTPFHRGYDYEADDDDPDGLLVPRSPPEMEHSSTKGMRWSDLEDSLARVASTEQSTERRAQLHQQQLQQQPQGAAAPHLSPSHGSSMQHSSSSSSVSCFPSLVLLVRALP